jgi:nucleotide-binding universal stress UspA family protein
MNKIILLSDKEQMPKGAFDFARMLDRQQAILLTGVFLPKNAMLVTGAQGRGGLSRLLRTSFISDVLKEHMLPVFIAHR